MEGLQTTVLIGVLLLVGGALAALTRIPTALVLLVLGNGFRFVSAFGEIALPAVVARSCRDRTRVHRSRGSGRSPR